MTLNTHIYMTFNTHTCIYMTLYFPGLEQVEGQTSFRDSKPPLLLYDIKLYCM